ncbi:MULTISPECIES: EAL domain-containing protein [unclassified Arthrobacter]|uniref:EAL domain-containing protein n=1 Tax=unclassified Arthrobacter TaxID=235627 RepID=UPI00031C24C2|nr:MULTISPECIES: EAL domain-containing protein [unclassified Arthrobacter]PVE18802.1 EAL domain-containing protein [Arthrobacter sp. Bz4]
MSAAGLDYQALFDHAPCGYLLAHAVGIKAVAEGVETEGQREALIGLACDLAQGYHYARPLPADELASWFAMESPDRTPVSPGAAAL